MNQRPTNGQQSLKRSSGPKRYEIWIYKESAILAAGIIIFVLFTLGTGISCLSSVEHCRKISSLALIRLVVGRPGGVYFGHILQTSLLTNVIVNWLIDVVAVMLVYPLFVFSLKNIFLLRSLQKFIQQVHQAAQQNYRKIHTYGVSGLFLFVLFPLWGTGPVVGSVIGYLMNLPPWYNMSLVLSATLLAIILWVFILGEIHTHALVISATLPIAIILIVVLGVVAARLVRHSRKKD